MKRLNLYTSILCLGLAASLPVHAQNGNSRGASNGQPFQELQSAIDVAEEAVNAVDQSQRLPHPPAAACVSQLAQD